MEILVAKAIVNLADLVAIPIYFLIYRMFKQKWDLHKSMTVLLPTILGMAILKEIMLSSMQHTRTLEISFSNGAFFFFEFALLVAIAFLINMKRQKNIKS